MVQQVLDLRIPDDVLGLELGTSASLQQLVTLLSVHGPLSESDSF
jgi:hypothetical protein